MKKKHHVFNHKKIPSQSHTYKIKYKLNTQSITNNQINAQYKIKKSSLAWSAQSANKIVNMQITREDGFPKVYN